MVHYLHCLHCLHLDTHAFFQKVNDFLKKGVDFFS